MADKKIKLRNEFYHGSGHRPFLPGDEISLPEGQADELIKAGIADVVVADTPEGAEPVSAPATKTAPAEPAETPPASAAAHVTVPAAPNPSGQGEAEPAKPDHA